MINNRKLVVVVLMQKGKINRFRTGRTSTQIAAKCFHETANPLFDAQYPFTLQAKPSINIKNSIDNGSIDFSERGV